MAPPRRISFETTPTYPLTLPTLVVRRECRNSQNDDSLGPRRSRLRRLCRFLPQRPWLTHRSLVNAAGTEPSRHPSRQFATRIWMQSRACSMGFRARFLPTQIGCREQRVRGGLFEGVVVWEGRPAQALLCWVSSAGSEHFAGSRTGVVAKELEDKICAVPDTP